MSAIFDNLKFFKIDLPPSFFIRFWCATYVFGVGLSPRFARAIMCLNYKVAKTPHERSLCACLWHPLTTNCKNRHLAYSWAKSRFMSGRQCNPRDA